MNKEKLYQATIKFHYKNKPMKFEIVNNLPNYGLCITAAFVCWSARITGKPNIEAFCEYVIMKEPGELICEPLNKFKL